MPAPSGTGSRAPDRRVGVDSYSYHRLLGETRRGERPPAGLFPRGSIDVVAHARALGLDFALLETCFLGDPGAFEPGAYLAQAGGVALGLSWGAPQGFAFGDRPDALHDLRAWMVQAAALDLTLLRIVVGGPAHLGRPVSGVVSLLRAACAVAAGFGLTLALENHGDLTAETVEHLLAELGDDGLRVCFDTANALRAGDDVAAAAIRLSGAIDVIHVKDCAGSWDDPAAGPVSLPPGDGVIPLAAVLDACPDALASIELGQLPPGADELELVAAYVEYLRER
jgi:sugar phosphate isomerase/epimerase